VKGILKVAHVVITVETRNQNVFVANIVLTLLMSAIAKIESKKSGTMDTNVLIVLWMIPFLMNWNQFGILRAEIALFAVHFAKITKMIASVAKNVAQRHAFAALLVMNFASSANAGVIKFSRIVRTRLH